MNQGILYGIGVGPGDPELLTIKAARLLGQAHVVLAAASTKNDYSTALDIARPHLRPDAEIIHLGFPMTRDEAELNAAWRDNAEQTLALLRQGRDCAFLTLGDPMTYSTFGYLHRTLLELDPDVRCQVVPGITSYQAAAARVAFPLAESAENLIVASGVDDPARLERLLDLADNAVILKAYKRFEDIREMLERMRLTEHTVLVSRLGLDGEAVVHDIRTAPKKPHYFSLALVKKRKQP